MSVFDDLVAAANPVIIERHIARRAGISWEIRQYLEVGGTPMDWSGCTATFTLLAADGSTVFTFSTVTLSPGWLTATATPTETTDKRVGTHVYRVVITNAAGRKLAFMSGKFQIEG